MLRLIRFIFTGDWHLHKWKNVSKHKIYAEGDEGGMPSNMIYHDQCEVCGKRRSWRLQ